MRNEENFNRNSEILAAIDTIRLAAILAAMRNY